MGGKDVKAAKPPEVHSKSLFIQLMAILAGEEAYLATVMLVTAGAAACMSASLNDQSNPINLPSVIFPVLLGFLNAYCTLFAPAFRDRSVLPQRIGLFVFFILISIIAYIVGLCLWSRTSLGVGIALGIGNIAQVVAVAVFAYTTLEERKLLAGISSEQVDEFKRFNEKASQRAANDLPTYGRYDPLYDGPLVSPSALEPPKLSRGD
jgi:hypothetical protein